MNRTRRIAATVVATTGILGGAGAAVAGVDSERDVTPDAPAAGASTAARALGTDPAAQDRQALQDYVAAMSARGASLDRKVARARARLAHAEAVRAARLAQAAQEQAAAAAAAAAAQAAAAPVAGSARPSVHTSTGASGSGGGEHDDGEHEGGEDD